MKDIVGLVAVRSASSRLPNKAFLPLSGKPLLDVLVDRLEATPHLDGFIICTTVEPGDDAIEALCRRRGVPVYRGPVENVLARFTGASETMPSEYVVRITGDNPLTDFEAMHEAFDHMRGRRADYCRPNGVPVGTASEVIRTAALHELLRRSLVPELSEYMTYFFELAPFVRCERYDVDRSRWMPDLRLTVDYEADLRFMNELFAAFGGRAPSLAETVGYCRALPDYPRVGPAEGAAEIRAAIRFA